MVSLELADNAAISRIREEAEQGIKVSSKGETLNKSNSRQLVLVPKKGHNLVDKDGNQVTHSGGVTTPEGISSQDVTFASSGSFNVRVEKIKDTNGMVQSGLTVVPEFQVGITSIVVTLAIAAIIITAKRMSFLQMSKMY
jgi:hypothetical protein